MQLLTLAPNPTSAPPALHARVAISAERLRDVLADLCRCLDNPRLQAA